MASQKLNWYQRLDWRIFLLFLGGLVLAYIPLWAVFASPDQTHDPTARALALSFVASAVMAFIAANLLRRHISGRFYEMNQQLRSSGPEEMEVRDEFDIATGTLREHVWALNENVQRMRQEKTRLDVLLQGMSEAVIMTDDTERVLVANRVAERLLRFPAEYHGKRLADIIELDALQDILSNVLWHYRPVIQDVDYPVRPNDIRHISVSAVPVSLDDRLGGAVLVMHDVTRLRRLERVRRDFVANVSHELRTPITAIQSSAETLLMVGERPDIERDFLETIHRNAGRMGTLVDDLLTLSRIEAADMDLPMVAVSLAEVVAEVLDRHEALSRKRGVALDAHLDDDMPMVRSDFRSLVHILQNLVENALKYTPEGGKVKIRAFTSDNRTIVQVSDTGLGIAENHIPRIFERFYRVDEGRSRDVGGTGLGLAIVKHLVRKVSGSIEVESEINEGSTFTIELPTYRETT